MWYKTVSTCDQNVIANLPKCFFLMYFKFRILIKTRGEVWDIAVGDKWAFVLRCMWLHAGFD